MKQKLGILLTTSPENENTNTVICLAETTISKGKEVEIFLMCDGVYNVYKKEFLAIRKKGIKLTLCSHNASERCISEVEGVDFVSLYFFAHMVNECDKMLSFT